MKPSHLHTRKRWLTLLLIACLHVGGLGAVMLQLDKPAPVITPPAMVGMLLAPPSVQPPQPLPATPEPPKPRPQHKPRPTPAPQPPAPNAPPSERAISAVPSADPVPAREESTSVAQTAPSAAVAEPSPGPAAVTPPYAKASHLDNPAPVYPAISRRLGEQGRVLIEAYILPDGTVGEIRLKRSCGHSRLDDSALQAVKRWRFVPARRGNEAIPYWYDLPIAFSLTS